MSNEESNNPRNRRSFLAKLGQIALGGFGAISLAKANHRLTPEQIVRAWESPEYRNTLTESQWSQLPANPAGEIERSEFSGNLVASGNGCSGNGCSGNGCSGNGCSGNGCSGNGCSGNGCSGNGCSGNGCSGNSCSGNSCGGNGGGDPDDYS
jgi:mersacidin/lichenicidin family type 2 lantibiotic